MKNFIKIISILSKKEKIFLIFLILFSFINSSLELISIGSIYPLALSALNIESSSDFIKMINMFIKNNLNIDLITFYLIIIFISFIVKNFFNILFSISLNYFLMKVFNSNAKNTMKNYLNLEFLNFISKGFPEFHGNIINQNNNFKGYILSYLTLISEFLVLFSILLIMAVLNFKITLSIFIFFLVFILIYGFLLKKKIKIWGHTKNNLAQDLNKNILEIYNSIKDIKILEKETFFSNKFMKVNNKFSFTDFKYQSLISINRNIIELLLLVLILIILIYLGFNDNLYNLVPILSMYVVAFFRIYPSVSKIINNLATIKFYKIGLDYFYNEQIKNKLSKSDQIKNLEKINFFYQIELKNIYFRYEKSKKFLLENINIVIKKGETIGIIGNNGSGKSTLCNIILGLIKPEKGSLIIDNKIDIYQNYFGYSKMLSFVPQKVYLINDTIKKNILFGSEDFEGENFDIKKIKIFSKLLSFDLKGYSGDILDYNVGEDGSRLSGGQKQRIAIARALYRNTEILIMDEPNNNLDSETEVEITKDFINSLDKKTIIIITHNPETLKYCDKVIEVKDSRIRFIK